MHSLLQYFGKQGYHDSLLLSMHLLFARIVALAYSQPRSAHIEITAEMIEH